MSHHNSLHDSPLQEAGSTGLNKFNLPSKLIPGKHPNLAPDFGRSVSILRPGESLSHFFTKENPQAWFTYCNSLCDHNGLLDDKAKIDALVQGWPSFLCKAPTLLPTRVGCAINVGQGWPTFSVHAPKFFATQTFITFLCSQTCSNIFIL